ncbi:MAG: PEP-utilizing enzyme [Methanolinea sp.]|nr:PEP-utilizing enzyme [Methanolinea sp.]
MAVKTYPRLVTFGCGFEESVPAEEFGNKAAHLATIASLGVRVPPGFCLGVTLCEEYFGSGETPPPDLPDLLKNGIARLEKATGLSFGSSRRPLIVSVRSGAPVSMPGVMETLLNIGLSRDAVRGLISLSGNPKFAWDSYRRLIQNFGEVICHHPPTLYRTALREVMESEEVEDEVELDAHSFRELANEYERIFAQNGGGKFPDSARVQLGQAAETVIRSWESPRAEAFRRLNLIREARGTAVTVQVMVFGNMGSRSGAGVAFTRNPWQGHNRILVDFKFGAQGEDVVSGDQSVSTQNEFQDALPEAFAELTGIAKTLESYYKDMQDLEFTIQNGELYILQTRSGKRSPYAALKIAVDLCQEGVISPSDVIWMLREVDLDAISIQRVRTRDHPIAVGIPASGGVAAGDIALSSARAEEMESLGREVILVRETPSPDDIPGIKAANALLTARGARTAHAAVVARQMGKVCVVGCGSLVIDEGRRRCLVGGQEFREGSRITVDGNSGNVFAGEVEHSSEQPRQLIAMVREWERSLQL